MWVEGLGPLEEGGGVPELLLLLPSLLVLTAALTVVSTQGGYLTRIPQLSSWLLGKAMTKNLP